MVSLMAAWTSHGVIPQPTGCVGMTLDARLVMMALHGHVDQRSQLEGASTSSRRHESPLAAGASHRNNGHAMKTNTDQPAAASEAWFTEQFEAVSRAMWCIALSIVGNRTIAEDVVQESAAIALSKLDEFTRGSNFNAWLSRIVRYVALNHARRRQRDRSSLTDPHALESIASQPTAKDARVVTDRGELRHDQESFDDRVTAALSTLDPTARASLLLRTVLNMPYREIASALDIPEGTAMSHVHRSRLALRALLADGIHLRDSKDDSDCE